MSHECERCGASVSARFARVFGTNDDEVKGCLECRSAQAVMDGAAAGLEPREVRRQGGVEA